MGNAEDGRDLLRRAPVRTVRILMTRWLKGFEDLVMVYREPLKHKACVITSLLSSTVPSGTLSGLLIFI